MTSAPTDRMWADGKLYTREDVLCHIISLLVRRFGGSIEIAEGEWTELIPPGTELRFGRWGPDGKMQIRIRPVDEPEPGRLVRL